MKDFRLNSRLVKEVHWEQPFLQLPIAAPPPWWKNPGRDDSSAARNESDDVSFPRVIIINISGEEEV